MCKNFNAIIEGWGVGIRMTCQISVLMYVPVDISTFGALSCFLRKITEMCIMQTFFLLVLILWFTVV